MSLSTYSDCRAKVPFVRTLEDFLKYKKDLKSQEALKARLLMNKLNPDVMTQEVETWLREKAGPAIGGTPSLSQIIERVKGRDVFIQDLLQKTSFEELGFVRPLTQIEKDAKVAE